MAKTIIKAFTDKSGVSISTSDLDLSGQLQLDNGTEALPSLAFSSDINTGLYRNAEDTLGLVTGGTERLVIDSSGNIGIGTASPSTELHVEGGQDLNNGQLRIDSNGHANGLGAITMYNTNGSPNASSRNWGIYNGRSGPGLLQFKSSSSNSTSPDTGTEIVTIDGINNYVGILNNSPSSYDSRGRNLVVGSGSGNQGISVISGTTGLGSLFFGDGTGAGDASAGFILYDHNANTMKLGVSDSTKMTVTSDGDIGIGTSNTVGNRLYLEDTYNGYNGQRFNNSSNTSAAGNRIQMSNGSTSAYMQQHSPSNTTHGGTNSFNIINNTGGVYLSTGATSWTSISDMRHKTKVLDFSNGLDKIKDLSVFTYKLNEDEDEHIHLGLSAQEVYPILPEVVSGTPDDKMGIAYDRLVPVLINAIQELEARLAAVENA